MNLRNLLLALVVTLPLAGACNDETCRQSDVKQFTVPDAARLNAVAFVGDYGEALAIVGDDGLIAINPDPEYGGSFTTTRPVEIDLHGISGGSGGLLFAVGNDGTVIGATGPNGPWQTLPSGTTADLWDIESLTVNNNEHLLAVGDEVILRRDPLTSQWSPLPAPDGGWGRLRAVVTDGARIYAVGLGGTVWSTLTPLGAWTREDTGSTVDFYAATTAVYNDDGLVVVGAGGTALRRANGWQPVRGDFRGEDLIAADGDHILAADGHVYRIPYFFEDGEFAEDPTERLAWSLPGARTLREGLGIAIVGEEGLAATVEVYCHRY